MKLALTCPPGLESVARKEIEMLWYTVFEARDKIIFFEGDELTVAKVNLWSRVGNKVYILLSQKKSVTTFDHLYDEVAKIDWGKYWHKNPVIVHAKSMSSLLVSQPAIQKIVKKSIVDKLIGKTGKILEEDTKKEALHIEIVLHKDELLVMINTTGEWLYKRGYKEDTGEAPIKENLAAGIVLLSGWKFKTPFLDPMCGSGTICIEAALIAKNIAPGSFRTFAFERWHFFSNSVKQKALEEAKKKVFQWEYTIIGTDIDSKNIGIARQNAKNAGVADITTFEAKDLKSYKEESLTGTLVTNPPYGERLVVWGYEYGFEEEDWDINQSDRKESLKITPELKELYKTLKELLAKNKELNGGCITNFPFDEGERNKWKRRKLYNWGKEVCFYKKQEDIKKR